MFILIKNVGVELLLTLRSTYIRLWKVCPILFQIFNIHLSILFIIRNIIQTTNVISDKEKKSQ